eukprot:4988873-Pleurochrysis_carterae.AAC.1
MRLQLLQLANLRGERDEQVRGEIEHAQRLLDGVEVRQHVGEPRVGDVEIVHSESAESVKRA